MIQNGSTLFISSPFSFKLLFTKPLKYVIHLFTNSRIEHVARFVNNEVLNVQAPRSEMMSFKDWLFKYGSSEIYFIEPKRPFTAEVIKNLKIYDDSCRGKKYDVFGAISAVDEFNFVHRDKSELFCSQQVFDGYAKIGIFKESDDKISPIELRNAMLRSPFFKNKWERLI